jgi:hypothetical protein
MIQIYSQANWSSRSAAFSSMIWTKTSKTYPYSLVFLVFAMMVLGTFHLYIFFSLLQLCSHLWGVLNREFVAIDPSIVVICLPTKSDRRFKRPEGSKEFTCIALVCRHVHYSTNFLSRRLFSRYHRSYYTIQPTFLQALWLCTFKLCSVNYLDKHIYLMHQRLSRGRPCTSLISIRLVNNGTSDSIFLSGALRTFGTKCMSGLNFYFGSLLSLYARRSIVTR